MLPQCVDAFSSGAGAGSSGGCGCYHGGLCRFTEFQELPSLSARMLWEPSRHCSCLLGVSGDRQGKFSELVCSSEKSVNGEREKKSVLIPISV